MTTERPVSRRLRATAAAGICLGLALLFALAAAPASAARREKTPVIGFTSIGNERLNEAIAEKIFLRAGKVKDWVGRYSSKSLTKEAVFDKAGRYWTVRVWAPKAGEIAEGRVDDASGRVTQAWTGPQVAWGMARGSPGAFGGKEINTLPVWLGFCAIFLLGLGDLRRPLSLRNLDLVALLSFSVSLWYFNQGRVFSSASLVYPPLALLDRASVLRGRTGKADERQPAGLAGLATGRRGGLSDRLSDRAQRPHLERHRRRLRRRDRRRPHRLGPVALRPLPLRHLQRQGAEACGPADSEGNIHNHIQPNGHCESSNPDGDTYGPVAYLSYIPGLELFGWSHKWDDLPAAHFTAILFDVLCIAGLALVGLPVRRCATGGDARFRLGRLPVHASTSPTPTPTTRSLPAFLIWGFWLVTSPWARGAAVALSGWTKIGSLIVAPLWSAYPEALRLNPLAWFGRLGRFARGVRADHDRGLLGAPARAQPDFRPRGRSGTRRSPGS